MSIDCQDCGHKHLGDPTINHCPKCRSTNLENNNPKTPYSAVGRFA